MKPRNTLILALIVAALGAYMWLVERPKIAKEEEKKTLLTVDRDRIASLKLTTPDATIELKKTDGTWRIVAPLETEADQTVVKALIGALAEAEQKKTIDDKPGNLATFGLDKPTAVVSMTLDDGTAVPKVTVGKTTPVGYSAYAQVGDSPAVVLTTAAFQSGVKKELKDLRDKTVLPVKEDAVQEVRITAPGEQEIALKKEGEAWSLVKPATAKADTAQVKSFLSTLRALRAADFVDSAKRPPDPSFGLVPPRKTVTLLSGDNRSQSELLVGAALPDAQKKEVYVERGVDGPVFTVSDSVLTSLAKKPSDFRDKTVVTFDKNTLGSLVVTRADGESFTLERKDGKWTVADAGDLKAKDLVIDRLVDDLRTLKGSDIASEAGKPTDFGLGQPAVTIALRGTDGNAIGGVRTAVRGTGADKKIFVAADGSGTIYTLNDYVYQRLDKHRSDFVESPPATPAPAAGAPAGGAPAPNG